MEFGESMVKILLSCHTTHTAQWERLSSTGKDEMGPQGGTVKTLKWGSNRLPIPLPYCSSRGQWKDASPLQIESKDLWITLYRI